MPDTAPTDVRKILHQISAVSKRPRYAFMILNLIAEVADDAGCVGPRVGQGAGASLIRDWLSEAMLPLADVRRRAALAARVAVQQGFDADGHEPVAFKEAVRLQAQQSGKTNVSRAVSDLVKTGLIRRHYQGWRTAHANRGGGREAVYTVEAEILAALRRRSQLI